MDRITRQIIEQRKYAKIKAPYITKCLCEGITPHPGPVDAQGNPIAGEFFAQSAEMSHINLTKPLPQHNRGCRRGRVVWR